VEQNVEQLAAAFQFLGENKAPESAFRSALLAAGIELRQADHNDIEIDGILAFTDLKDAVIEKVQFERARLRGQVLVISAGEPLSSNALWKLLRSGASDVLTWGNDLKLTCAQIRAKLQRSVSVRRLATNACARGHLVGECPRWVSLVNRIVEAACFSESPLLLFGESGTGKELLARLVHMLHPSQRDAGRISDPVTVDCSTLSPELSGSELFGHERGAFTGAINAREGAFALADRGTLFLDEIGELPLPLQTHLLRAIQEKTYKRVGGNVWQTSEFRLVCATNRNLSQLVEEGRFRLDLYHRLAGWVFWVPPLRERREDILPLANHILQSIRPDHVGSGPYTIGDIPEDDRPSGGALQSAWPDDRFESTIAQAVAVGRGLRDITQAASEAAIRIAVQSERGNLQRAARRLGITDRASECWQQPVGSACRCAVVGWRNRSAVRLSGDLGSRAIPQETYLDRPRYVPHFCVFV
jgi:DNA-binding NtrC family response regulator